MDEESLIDAERMAIFEQKMRELTAEFIVTLDEWRTELEIFCTGGKAWTPDDLKQILMILHRIAGSAAIYGFVSLGEEARALETQIEEGGVQSKERVLDGLRHLLEQCAAAKAEQV